MLKYFPWQFGIAELAGVNIHDSDFHSVFHFDFANLVQERLPETVLRKIVGDALRDENVTRIAAIHDALRDVNPGTGDVRPVVDIFDLIDRAAVHTHP